MGGNIIKYVMFTSISAAAILFELKNLIHNSTGIFGIVLHLLFFPKTFIEKT